MEFPTTAKFAAWLSANHDNHGGIWLRIYKKASGRPTVTYAEALDEALCHGWIDGQKRTCDGESWLQRFTPRGKRSAWSQRNTEHVERLVRDGRMKPAGLAAVEAAKADGRWAAAYSSYRTFEVPPEFAAALAANPQAAAFFATLNKANRFAMCYRFAAAKRPETKARRLREFMDLLAQGKKLY